MALSHEDRDHRHRRALRRARHLAEYRYRLEYGTPGVLGIVGLSRGLDHLAEWGWVSASHARQMELARVLWDGLRQTDGVTHSCADSLERRIPLFTFSIRGMDPAQAGARLDVDFDVACRTGLHCAPLVHETLGTAPDGAIRMSVGALTTLADVEAGVRAVRALAVGGPLLAKLPRSTTSASPGFANSLLGQSKPGAVASLSREDLGGRRPGEGWAALARDVGGA